MPNYRGGVKAICPYYQHESKYTITCEGIFENSQQQVKFSTKADKMRHVSEVCSSFGYSRFCPVARMLEKKYESA